MARFLLVHGSCHGAWCWREVIRELRAMGHEARAIDLPAHGEDPASACDATLESYAEAILAAIGEPVTLVGHSAGGYPITLAAEIAPEKIRRLVYLCAYIPAPGMSMIEMRRAGPRQPLKGAVIADAGGLTYSISGDKARRTFFHDCDDALAGYAVARLCPEPIAPQSTALPPLRHWPQLERHYIVCDDDHTIPPEYQRVMSAEFPEGNVTSLPCGHSPFLSMPADLARHLGQIEVGISGLSAGDLGR